MAENKQMMNPGVKEKAIKAVLLIALAAAILLPLYNVFFIYPSFKKQLIQNIEGEAVRVAEHLSSMFVNEAAELTKDNLPHDLIHMSEAVKKDFKLWKLKIFSKSGEVIYSTDPKDIGDINKYKYFHEIVAKGKVHSVIVKKGTLTLEEQKVAVDVAETYVPIMRDGRFVGAFEIYYDITAKKGRLDTLINHYSCILFFVGILSIALIIFLFKANKEITAEKKRWDITFDSINDPVAIIDRKFKFIRVNKAMADKLGIPKEKAIGLTCYETVHGKSEPTAQCPHNKLLSDGQVHVEEVYEERLGGGGYYLVSVSPIYDSQGQVTSSVHIAHDINELKKTEERLRQSVHLLEIIGNAQKKFIAFTDSRPLFEELLNSFLSLTNSEYGIIGEIRYKAEGVPYLKCHAITNIAWTEELKRFYEENAPKGLEFYNMNTLFGAVIKTGKTVISNNPYEDPRRGGLPEGHPPLNAFLGLPLYSGNKLVGMAGIANRPDGYNEEMVEFLQPFLTTCGSIIEAYRNEQLRKKTEESLKKAYEELSAKNKELERFHNLTVDRELHMIELKDEVNALLKKSGQPKKYETPGNI